MGSLSFGVMAAQELPKDKVQETKKAAVNGSKKK
jgi:hypothetical protein